MKEELQIKVKVDTSNITTTLNKLKNEVSNVEKTMGTTSSSSSSIATSTDKAAQAQTKLTERVSQMVAKIKGMKGMGFGEMAASIIAGNAALEVTKKKIKEIQKEASKPSTVIRSKMTDVIDSSIGGLQNTNGEGGFKVIDDSSLEQIKKLKDLKGKVFSAETTKELKALKKDMKELGLSTKGTGLSLKNLGAALKTSEAAATALSGALGAVALALVAVVAGIAKAFQVSKLGAEVYHTAHRFNMGTEAFQEWSYVMERAGGSIDDLTGFMETLASEQAAVIEGSEGSIENFKRLGISAEEAAGMNQQALFETTVARIQSIGDATERSAIAYSIFGDEASKFMNVLNMSNGEMTELVNNYHMLGGAMSGELLESSTKLQNSVAGLKQAWSGIGNAIAQVFMPIAQKLVDWLTKVLVVVQLFVKTIFGLDLRSTGAGDAMDSAASSTSKYAASTKAATKAAEELKRVTMGFDELNIVSNPNKGGADSSGGSTSPSLGGIGDLGAAIPDMSSLGLDGIYAWFEEYKGVIAQIATWSLLLIGILLAVIGCMTVNVPMAMAGFAMAGLGITIGIKSGAFAEAWEAVKKIAVKAGEWIAGIPGWFWESICVPIGEFFVNLWNSIVDGVSKAWGAIVNFVKSIPGWIYNNILAPIGNFFVNLYNSIKNGVTNAWNGVMSVLSTVGGWINSKIVQPVISFFGNMWGGFKSGASKAWEGIKSVFSGIANWFRDIFAKAWTAVKNVFSTGGKIFDGIKEGIANVFKTVVNGIIGGINKVIAVPFNAINGLLNKIRNISVAGIEPFKDLIKYNALSVPQIPKLATGGIVTGSTIANIGEAGREAVLPLDNNTEWMDMLADRIASRNSAPSKIVLQVGERELGWASINGINQITKQTGTIQLAL